MGAFAPVAVSVNALISNLGRDVILRRNSGSVAIHADRPWEGVTAVSADTSIKAVFDAYTARERAGTEIQAEDVKAYVATNALGAFVPAPGDVIVDGSSHMRIVQATKYHPGTDSIAFELQLRPS